MPIATKMTSKSVQAWACALCGSVHGERVDADKCCQCSECRGKFEREYAYSSSVCDGCNWGRNVRSARADIRRHQELLDSSKKHLSELLAKKTPKAISNVLHGYDAP